MRLTCLVTAPFFDPVAFASSLVSGFSASRIWIAAVATDSSSRGASRRSSRIAVERTSSRIFFESSVESFGAISTNRPPTSPRTSSRLGSSCSSAQLFSPRTQKSSSSSKSFSLPFVKKSRRRWRRPSSAASCSSRSTSIRSASALTLSSRSFSAFARSSLSTDVTIEAAK